MPEGNLPLTSRNIDCWAILLDDKCEEAVGEDPKGTTEGEDESPVELDSFSSNEQVYIPESMSLLRLTISREPFLRILWRWLKGRFRPSLLHEIKIEGWRGPVTQQGIKTESPSILLWLLICLMAEKPWRLNPVELLAGLKRLFVLAVMEEAGLPKTGSAVASVTEMKTSNKIKDTKRRWRDGSIGEEDETKKKTENTLSF